MSKSIVWPISAEHVEQLITIKHNLESPCSIWAAGFDNIGSQICIVVEVDDEDADRLLAGDDSIQEFEESDLVR